MAVYIPIVRGEVEVGYTASFSDFPGLAVAAASLDQLFAKARQKIAADIEHLIDAHQPVGVPKSADTAAAGNRASKHRDGQHRHHRRRLATQRTQALRAF
jgi:predicted RNase H-like HicB family nuclease